jgi:hypothetical protein
LSSLLSTWTSHLVRKVTLREFNAAVVIAESFFGETGVVFAFAVMSWLKEAGYTVAVSRVVKS